MYQYIRHTSYMPIVQHVTHLITKQFSVEISIPICLMPFWQLPFSDFIRLCQIGINKETDWQSAIQDLKLRTNTDTLPYTVKTIDI